jgi:1-acyl-sn-glycerol-3-phosphate acyltransferase
MAYLIIKKIFSPIIKLIWVSKVEGLEHIPKKGSVIIAANHCSYFDFLCLVAVSPRPIYFLAAEKFFASKFWRPLMLATGQIMVDRKSNNKDAVIEAAKGVLDFGAILGIFPEGTRSRTGKIQKAYSGVAKIAIENKVNVIPAGIIGAFDVMSPHDKLPKFKKIVSIKFGSSFDVVSETDAQLFTDKIMKKIEELSGNCREY